MHTFFKRLLYIVEFEGFKNLNDFALNGLNYQSSSKLNRLKDESKSPSIEILLDISNKFVNVNLHWLITGDGNSHLNNYNLTENKIDHVAEPEVKIHYDYEKLLAAEKEINLLLRDKIEMLLETIENLKKELEHYEPGPDVSRSSEKLKK